jgi:predicted RNA-binding protein
MCQSTVYLREGDKEKEILRDAILVERCPDGIKVQGFFDSPQVIPASIESVDLLEHKIILSPKDRNGEHNADD